jgi:Ca-activated chloride channel family protein
MNNLNEAPIAVLKDSTGHSIALQGVSVRGRLTETLASIEVEQRYRNPLRHNIEAVYTFPLPMGSVLLDMEVEIADRILAGQVIEKQVAEQRYEEAITDGNSAIMVQALGDGLYSMNVGNLLAGESAVIRYRYALTLSWQGDQLRLTIPTTIAPRFGDAAATGLEPWQIPASSLMAEYPFALTVSIEGKLADAEIASPTHPVGITRTECGFDVTLNREATLDRDFVLTAKAMTGHENTCLVVNDGEQKVALATLRIPPIIETTRTPLCLKMVIDCSGSMSGVSIAQARKAALAMLDLLKPEDSFNVTLFGDNHEHLFDRMVSADARHIQLAQERLKQLDANLGGTETGKALAAVYKLQTNASIGMPDRIIGKKDAEQTDRPKVLLITDGEIWNTNEILDLAAKSGHQVFTVGVGLSVAEGFVTALAKATGAACELVSPQEGMADKVLSQFHRLQQPMFGQAEVVWDVMPTWQTPIPAVLFAGDTIHVYAGFENGAPGSARLHMPNTTVDTSAVSAIAEPVDLPDVCRLAAHARIGMCKDEVEQVRLTVHYQLLTELTNFLVVAERLEKADNLPMLHQVPQMLAAGYGGAGVSSYAAPAVMYSRSHGAMDFGQIPAVVRKRIVTVNAMEMSYIRFLDRLNALANRKLFSALPNTRKRLVQQRMPQELIILFDQLVAEGNPESEVLQALYQALIDHSGSKRLGDALVEKMQLVMRNTALNKDLKARFLEMLNQVWGSQGSERLHFKAHFNIPSFLRTYAD